MARSRPFEEVYQEGYAEGYAEGYEKEYEKGYAEEGKKAAAAMLRAGESFSYVMRFAGLTEEEVKELVSALGLPDYQENAAEIKTCEE